MKARKSDCSCPFCEQELTHHCAEPAFCQPCEVELVECAKCRKKFGRSHRQCPHCGTPYKDAGRKQ